MNTNSKTNNMNESRDRNTSSNGCSNTLHENSSNTKSFVKQMRTYATMVMGACHEQAMVISQSISMTCTTTGSTNFKSNSERRAFKIIVGIDYDHCCYHGHCCHYYQCHYYSRYYYIVIVITVIAFLSYYSHCHDCCCHCHCLVIMVTLICSSVIVIVFCLCLPFSSWFLLLRLS